MASVRRLPTDPDLAAIVAWVAAGWTAALAPVHGWLRLAVALPLVLVIPGYAVVAALFPERAGEKPSESTAATTESTASIAADSTATTPEPTAPDALERAALAVGCSLALVVLLGVGLHLTVGIGESSVLAGLSLLVVVPAVVAHARRPAPGVRLTGWLGVPRPSAGRSATPDPSRLDAAGAAVGGLVVLAGIAGAGGIAALAVHEPPGYVEFYALPGANGTADGDAAVGYDALARGEPLTLRVENHHDAPREFVLVVTLQRVSRSEGVAVLDRRELDRTAFEVGPGETWSTRHELDEVPADGPYRVVYRLYRGSAPARPGEDDAHATLHVWVTGNATANAMASERATANASATARSNLSTSPDPPAGRSRRPPGGRS